MIPGECWPEKNDDWCSREQMPEYTKFGSEIIIYIDIWCSSLFAECVCVLGVETKR